MSKAVRSADKQEMKKIEVGVITSLLAGAVKKMGPAMVMIAIQQLVGMLQGQSDLIFVVHICGVL